MSTSVMLESLPPAASGTFTNQVQPYRPQLHPLNLSRPEATLDLSFFHTNPQPFYTRAKSLNPGQFTPTVTHALISHTETTCRTGHSPRTYALLKEEQDSRCRCRPEPMARLQGSLVSSVIPDTQVIDEWHIPAESVPLCEAYASLE
ncbi:hypothetical protein HOY82DRAFT_635890 [Tuber indicum]|nr:hypothetical protein HOY82DRAFT_635890 [Tuber indicum]